MIPAKFDYVRPTTVDDAVAALVAGGDDAKVITGGQSLLPLLRTRLAAPSLLVDCGRIEEMREAGCLATLEPVFEPLVSGRWPVGCHDGKLPRPLPAVCRYPPLVTRVGWLMRKEKRKCRPEP